MIIVITGTPGVGKTEVSQILSKRLNAVHLDLNKIAKEGQLTLGIDKEKKSLIADLDRLSDRVQVLIKKSSRDLIIEGHYASDIVPPNLASYVFVLRKDPDTLKADLKRKGFKGQKVSENVAAEILGLCLSDTVDAYGLKKVCEIDTTSKRVVSIIEEIMLVLDGEEKPSVGKVDWLSKLEKEGRLEKFMEYSSTTNR
ncbi:MAG: adenylate kinase family protein [Candidatus Bathyarchaeota archaeon]|nr:adenylate kinase family protein [Candidatus Bathyarchaeota archaeon]